MNHRKSQSKTVAISFTKISWMEFLCAQYAQKRSTQDPRCGHARAVIISITSPALGVGRKINTLLLGLARPASLVRRIFLSIIWFHLAGAVGNLIKISPTGETHVVVLATRRTHVNLLEHLALATAASSVILDRANPLFAE